MFTLIFSQKFTFHEVSFHDRDVFVGDNAKIGADAIVWEDLPANTKVVDVWK